MRGVVFVQDVRDKGLSTLARAVRTAFYSWREWLGQRFHYLEHEDDLAGCDSNSWASSRSRAWMLTILLTMFCGVGELMFICAGGDGGGDGEGGMPR